VAVRDLDDWSRKCFYLPRVATDQVIFNALVNAQAALTDEATFHFADGFDEGTGRYSGLRPQQDPKTGSASLTSLVVKDGVAAVQIEADRRAEEERKRQASKPEVDGGGGAGLGIVNAGNTGGPGPIPPPPPPLSHLQALPGVEIEMSLEVKVRAPGGIDEATARIVLENSASLKVDKPGLY
jgi:hypothetical protein